MNVSDIIAAQNAWAAAVIKIGKSLDDPLALNAAADAILDDLYAYGSHDVLFKPTFPEGSPFRLTRASARSYFVGGDPDYPDDVGFAKRPWIDVRFENAGIIADGTRGLAMGRYRFTDPVGTTFAVEYSFAYVDGDEGFPRLCLHHSSLPAPKRNP